MVVVIKAHVAMSARRVDLAQPFRQAMADAEDEQAAWTAVPPPAPMTRRRQQRRAAREDDAPQPSPTVASTQWHRENIAVPNISRTSNVNGGATAPRKGLSTMQIVFIAVAVVCIIALVVWLIIRKPWRKGNGEPVKSTPTEPQGHVTEGGNGSGHDDTATELTRLWTSDDLVNTYLAVALQNTELRGKAAVQWATQIAAEVRAREQQPAAPAAAAPSLLQQHQEQMQALVVHEQANDAPVVAHTAAVATAPVSPTPTVSPSLQQRLLTVNCDNTNQLVAQRKLPSGFTRLLAS